MTDTNSAAGETAGEVENITTAPTEGAPVKKDGDAAKVQKPDAGSDAEGSTENQNGNDGKPRKGGFQKKIEKLTSERDALAAQLAANKTAAVPPEKKTAETEDKPPNQDDFDTYDEFIRADARYWARKETQDTLKQRDDDVRNQKLIDDRNAVRVKYHEREKTFVEKTPDFEETIAGSDTQVSDALRDAIHESELGPELIYHLAKNPEEADRLNKLGITALYREIGKLETKLESKSDGTAASEENSGKKAATPSKAPAPFKPVNSGAASNKLEYRESMTQAEYEAMRRQQHAAKGGGR